MSFKSMKESKFKALGDKPVDGSVIIEGFANKFKKDAYNERMDPLSVKLDRYKQNPILLFNHDMNYPCGRVILVEPREDGLFVRAAVSKSEHEKIAFVRELVSDGTLCTFSVRFADEQVVEDPENIGGKLIKNWELQEVSIVSIPAQPDSTFSLSQAKSLGEARQMVLKAKGAMVAKYVAEHMDKLEKAGQSKEELLEKLTEVSGSEAGKLTEILAGNVTPVPEPVLSAFVQVLGCDEQEIKEQNAKDVEAQKSIVDENAESEEQEKEVEEKEVEEKEVEEKEEQKAEQEPVSQTVQDCVSEKIPVLIEEGKSQEEAVAIAISMCSKEKGCKDFAPTKDMMAKWLEQCENIKQAEQGDAPTEGGALPNREPEGMNDNALLMLMKSQLEMLGAISVKLDKLADVFMESKAGYPMKEEMPKEEKPEDKSKESDEQEKDEMTDEMKEQMKTIIEKYEQKLKTLLT